MAPEAAPGSGGPQHDQKHESTGAWESNKGSTGAEEGAEALRVSAGLTRATAKDQSKWQKG